MTLSGLGFPRRRGQESQSMAADVRHSSEGPWAKLCHPVLSRAVVERTEFRARSVGSFRPTRNAHVIF